jgi:hypothetical protein
MTTQTEEKWEKVRELLKETWLFLNLSNTKSNLESLLDSQTNKVISLFRHVIEEARKEDTERIKKVRSKWFVDGDDDEVIYLADLDNEFPELSFSPSEEKCNCHYQCGCDKGKCNCYSTEEK